MEVNRQQPVGWEKNSSNYWTTIGNDSFPPRIGFTAKCYKDTLFVFGGKGSKEHFGELLSLSLNNQQSRWETLTNNGPYPRSFHSSNIFGDKLLIFGGKSGNKIHSDLWSYDFLQKKWFQLKQFPSNCQRHSHQSAIRKNKLLIFGGSFDSVLVINLDTLQHETIKILGNHILSLIYFGLVSLDNGNLISIGGVLPNQKIINLCSFIQVPEALQEQVIGGLNHQLQIQEEEDSLEQESKQISEESKQISDESDVYVWNSY